MTLRASPKQTLQDVLLEICDERGLEARQYTLPPSPTTGPTVGHVPFDGRPGHQGDHSCSQWDRSRWLFLPGIISTIFSTGPVDSFLNSFFIFHHSSFLSFNPFFFFIISVFCYCFSFEVSGSYSKNFSWIWIFLVFLVLFWTRMSRDFLYFAPFTSTFDFSFFQVGRKYTFSFFCVLIKLCFFLLTDSNIAQDSQKFGILTSQSVVVEPPKSPVMKQSHFNIFRLCRKKRLVSCSFRPFNCAKPAIPRGLRHLFWLMYTLNELFLENPAIFSHNVKFFRKNKPFASI